MPRNNSSNSVEAGIEVPSDQHAHDREIFSRHADLFRLFTLGQFEVYPPKAGMQTFQVDLMPITKGEKAIVYASPAFYEKTGRSSEKAVNSFLHELNHIQEIVDLLQEDDGIKIWREEQTKKRQSRWLKILDNIQDDIRMDRRTLERAPSQAEIQEAIYREDLYPSTDFSKLPRHLQFMYAMFRESMLPSEECVVAPEVREHLRKLKEEKGIRGKLFWDFHTSPDIKPSLRIRLREKKLEPIVKELFEQDATEAKEKKETGKGRVEGEEEGQSSDKDSGKPANPEDYFKDWYDEFDQKNPDQAFKPEDLIKEIEKAVKAIEEEKKKTPEERALETYAKAEGVTVPELMEYRRFYAQLEQIINPETGDQVIEELRAIFKKIVSERMEKKEVPHYPREEGEILYDPAQAVAAVKAGQTDPAVWITYERDEERREKYGGFDIVIVGDRSISMAQEGKAIEQRKAVMLLVEALREFAEELEERKMQLLDDLEVRTEVRTFGDAKTNELLKPLGGELTEKQRIFCFKKMNDASGKRTEDYKVLRDILKSIPEEDQRKIEEKKLRKIVIVLTDGESSQESALKDVLKELRSMGVKIACIGIKTEVKAYAPDGKKCSAPSQLAIVLSELLKEFLGEL